MKDNYPLTSGSWIDYTVIKIKGAYHRLSMQLGVSEREVIPADQNGRQRITCLSSGGLVARVYGKAGVTCTQIPPTNAVLYSEITPDGIGEVAGFTEGPSPGPSDDFATFTVPPILLLPNRLTLNSSLKLPIRKAAVYRHQNGIMSRGEDFLYQTGVISNGVPWGPWNDTARIGYIENPPRGPVFNYVYADGIGPVNFWYGELNPDDTLAWGIEYYATAWGGQ